MAGPAGASSTDDVDHTFPPVPGARNGLPTSVAGTGFTRVSGRTATFPPHEPALACIRAAAPGSTASPHEARIDVTPRISSHVGFHPGWVVRSVIWAVSPALDCRTYPQPGPDCPPAPIAHSRGACWYHDRNDRRCSLLHP